MRLDIEDVFGGLSISNELSCRRLAREAVIFPKKYESAEHSNNSSVQDYLSVCKQNILAEVWAFLQRSTHSFPGWRDKLLEFVLLGDLRLSTEKENSGNMVFQRASRIKKGSLTREASEPVRLEEIASYLVIFRNHICLTRSVKNGMEIISGVHLESLNKSDCQSPTDEDGMYLIGYIRPYMEDLATVLMFINNILPANQILRAVASPALRQPFPFDSRDFSCAVPSNAKQREIILRLNQNLEVIQGPPGTGSLNAILLLSNP